MFSVLQEYINAYADCLVRANGDAESQDGKRLVRWPENLQPCHAHPKPPHVSLTVRSQWCMY